MATESPDALHRLIKGSMGSGKTEAALKAIAQLRDSVIFAVPTSTLALEVYARYLEISNSNSPMPVIIHGRSARDSAVKNAAMCLRSKVAEEVAEAELPVGTTLCKSCPQFSSCGYQRQKEEIGKLKNTPVLYIVSHQYLFLESFLPEVRGYVIDEAFNAVGMADFTLDRISRCIEGGGHGTTFFPKEQRKALATLEHILINEHSGSYLQKIRERLPLPLLRRTATFLQNLLDGNIPDLGKRPDDEIHAALHEYSRREIKQVLCLIQQAVREWQQPRESLNSIFIAENMPSRSPAGERERQRRVCVSFLRPLTIPQKSSVLILDGTGDERLYRKILDDDVETHIFNIAVKAWVTQINSRSFSRQSITGLDMFGKPRSDADVQQARRLRGELVTAISTCPPGPLVVGNKIVINDHLKPLLQDSVHLGHFGALRGLNQYAAVKNIMLVGREQPSAWEVERIARAYAADEPLPFLSMVDAERPYGQYVKSSRMRRLADGTTEPQELDVHPEPLAQAVLEQIREANSMQALARVRPITNDCNITIASNLVLDISVNRSMSWPEFCQGGSRLEQLAAISPVVPLSAKEMHRLFQKMWPSQKAAERNLERTPLLQIYSLLERRGFLRCRYRLIHSSSSPYEAYVKGSRATLEAVTGSVVWFECHGYGDVGQERSDEDTDMANEQPQQQPAGESQVIVFPIDTTATTWTPADWEKYRAECTARAIRMRNVTQAQAECDAHESCVSHWLDSHPAPQPDNNICLHCGGIIGPTGAGAVATASGHWLHHACHAPWLAARRQEATAALAGMKLLTPLD